MRKNVADLDYKDRFYPYGNRAHALTCLYVEGVSVDPDSVMTVHTTDNGLLYFYPGDTVTVLLPYALDTAPGS